MRGFIFSGLVLLVGTAWACPDYGVAIKADKANYAGLDIRTTAKSVVIVTDAKVSYVVGWKGTLTDGKWCFKKSEAGETKETCQTPKTVNQEFSILNKDGKIVAVLRLYEKPTKLAGTEKTGALMAIVQNGRPDPDTIDYRGPWFRFVYAVDVKPATLKTNDRTEIDKQLRAEGAKAEDVAKTHSLHHTMYVDYFNQSKGFSDSDRKILGTLELEKTEIPLSPLLRETPKNGEADLDGQSWQGKKDGKGCQTEVEKKS